MEDGEYGINALGLKKANNKLILIKMIIMNVCSIWHRKLLSFLIKIINKLMEN